LLQNGKNVGKKEAKGQTNHIITRRSSPVRRENCGTKKQKKLELPTPFEVGSQKQARHGRDRSDLHKWKQT